MEELRQGEEPQEEKGPDVIELDSVRGQIVAEGRERTAQVFSKNPSVRPSVRPGIRPSRRPGSLKPDPLDEARRSLAIEDEIA